MKYKSKFSKVTESLPIDEIIKLYVEEKQGSSAIAKQYNCNPDHILDILKSNNILVYKRNNVDKEKIKRLRKEGYTVKKLMEEFKIGRKLIYSILKKEEAQAK